MADNQRFYREIKVNQSEHMQESRRLMQLIVDLLQPLMMASGVKLNLVFELDPNNPMPGMPTGGLILGVYDPYQRNYGMLLRDHYIRDGRRWAPFEDIMSVAIHELSHAKDHQIHGALYTSQEEAHGPRFYRELFLYQEQYYKTFSAVQDDPKTFIPSYRLVKEMAEGQHGEVFKTLGWDEGKIRSRGTAPDVPYYFRDWVVEIRQWAIERKLDAEAAKEVGENSEHYKGDGENFGTSDDLFEEGEGSRGGGPGGIFGGAQNPFRNFGPFGRGMGGGRMGGGHTGGGAIGGGFGDDMFGGGQLEEMIRQLSEMMGGMHGGHGFGLTANTDSKGEGKGKETYKESPGTRARLVINDIYSRDKKRASSAGGDKYFDEDGYTGLKSHAAFKMTVSDAMGKKASARAKNPVKKLSVCVLTRNIGDRAMKKYLQKQKAIDIDDIKPDKSNNAPTFAWNADELAMATENVKKFLDDTKNQSNEVFEDDKDSAESKDSKPETQPKSADDKGKDKAVNDDGQDDEEDFKRALEASRKDAAEAEARAEDDFQAVLKSSREAAQGRHQQEEDDLQRFLSESSSGFNNHQQEKFDDEIRRVMEESLKSAEEAFRAQEEKDFQKLLAESRKEATKLEAANQRQYLEALGRLRAQADDEERRREKKFEQDVTAAIRESAKLNQAAAAKEQEDLNFAMSQSSKDALRLEDRLNEELERIKILSVSDWRGTAVPERKSTGASGKRSTGASDRGSNGASDAKNTSASDRKSTIIFDKKSTTAPDKKSTLPPDNKSAKEDESDEEALTPEQIRQQRMRRFGGS